MCCVARASAGLPVPAHVPPAQLLFGLAVHMADRFHVANITFKASHAGAVVHM